MHKEGLLHLAAHLISVCLYYRAFLFMYMHPGSAQADDEDMMDSLFYIAIIPLLNPVIYNLKNKRVVDSLAEIVQRNA